ncbi:MAG TPA: AAA family ATPase [Actinomycetota bacterium]|nr:AAA family ATPase [Actinomycetota bacterium]
MQACPVCGERNPERASFCLACGAPLGRRAAVEERKTVTVLVCDLVGFTARSDRADPEDVKAMLVPYHAMLTRQLEKTGGTLDAFIGDAAVGVFGAPVAHEDDPERAVRSAFAILESLGPLNEELPGPDLAVRIGVATGEAFVQVDPGPQLGERVTGDVVRLASTLQAAAPAGGVAVSEATYRATRELFVYEPLGPLPRGPAEPPLTAWRAVRTRSRLVRETSRTPFVGREEESAMLRAAFRRAVAEPSVQLVTITGEPGVGKSRLIAELAGYLDEVPEIIRWRVGRCPPYGDGVSFWALSEIVKAETDILDSDPAEEALGKLAGGVARLVQDPSERDWLLARLAPLVGLGGEAPSADRNESFHAWRRYLEAMAAHHATVLVFEDLQWADPALIEFVEHLVDWATSLPLLVICAARPELYERRPGWGGGKRNSTTIALPPLSEAETAMLISGLLDRAVLPPETQRSLLERAGGNPLYAEEFVRMLTDRGSVGLGGAFLAEDAGGVAVPESVQALIAARLDTLPPESKALLRDAAVLGPVFWSGALAFMSGADEAEVRSRLHQIAGKELVRPVRTSSVEHQEEYAFWHVLVRDVAYGQIPRGERGRKHRTAARWIESLAGDRVSERAEVLAHHYGRALELARAAGEAEEVPGLERTTARYLQIAGDRALRLNLPAAETSYRRALELLPPGHPDRPAALVRTAEAVSLAGRFREADGLYGQAIEGFRALGNVRGLGEALALWSRAASQMGDTARSGTLLRQAVELLEREPPGPELARAYSRQAGSALLAARWDESRALAERALGLAEGLGLEQEVVRARQYLGAARCELGDDGGLADLWGALRLALELGIGEETAVTYSNLAYQLWLRDGPAIALQVLEAAEEFCRIRGFASMMMWAKAGKLEALFDLGRWDPLLDAAAEIEESERREGGARVGVFAMLYPAMVHVRRGRVHEAAALQERFLPLALAVQHAEVTAPAYAVAAQVALARGRPAEALELAEAFARATEATPSFRLHYLPDVLRVLAAGERSDLAAALVPDESLAVSGRHRIDLVTARAILAEAGGDLEEARALYAEAGVRWLAYGSALEHALALAGEGRCLSATGRAEAAAEPLRLAREALATLGARADLERVNALAGG